MIFNLITKAKELFYKNGKTVEAALDELNESLDATNDKLINFGWIPNLDSQSEIAFMSIALYSGQATNAPSNKAGVVMAYKADGMTIQNAFSWADNVMYVRNHTSEWSGWTKYVTNSDLDWKFLGNYNSNDFISLSSIWDNIKEIQVLFKVGDTFVVVGWNKTMGSGTYTNGFYYSEKYYTSQAIKIDASAKNIQRYNGWCRTVMDGSVFTEINFNVYYR